MKNNGSLKGKLEKGEEFYRHFNVESPKNMMMPLFGWAHIYMWKVYLKAVGYGVGGIYNFVCLKKSGQIFLWKTLKLYSIVIVNVSFDNSKWSKNARTQRKRMTWMEKIIKSNDHGMALWVSFVYWYRDVIFKISIL